MTTKRYKQFVGYSLILCVALLCFACKPLPIRTSKYVASESNIKDLRKELPFSYYDAFSKIRYDIYNSSTHLFIQFDVSDQLTINKIFSFGLEIYVDTLNKRKKHEGLIYPTAGAVKENSIITPQTGPQIPDKNTINELQKNLSPLVTIIHNNIEENRNIFSKDCKVTIKMDLSDKGNLSYQAKIPFSEFGIDSLETGQEFSIGILTGEMPRDENNEEDQNNNQSPMSNPYNQNNLYGGNSGYNPNYQPGYTGRPGQARPLQNNYRKELEPVNIWMKTQINLSNK